MAVLIKLEEMLAAGCHLGHQARRWNPKMASYIYGVKEGIHVFDLVKTREAMIEALERLEDAVKKGQTILFVGTKKQAKDRLTEIAEKFAYPYITDRWLGGTLTNFDQMRKSVKKLVEIEENLKTGGYTNLTKKERLLVSRDAEKLRKIFGGVVGLEKLPDVMFIVDTHKEKGAVIEAQKLESIETIGIVDTNADPEDVDWVIPTNDDANSALEYVLGLVEKTLEGAKSKKK